MALALVGCCVFGAFIDDPAERAAADTRISSTPSTANSRVPSPEDSTPDSEPPKLSASPIIAEQDAEAKEAAAQASHARAEANALALRNKRKWILRSSDVRRAPETIDCLPFFGCGTSPESFEGTVTVKNISTKRLPAGSVIKVIVMKKSKVIVEEEARTNVSVQPGQSVDAEWSSINRYQKGPFKVSITAGD